MNVVRASALPRARRAADRPPSPHRGGNMSTRRSLDRAARVAAFALVAALPACSRHHPGEAIDPDEPAMMTFRNESLAQADVFAIAQGSNAMRIGTVMAGRTETLRIPADVANRGTI